ncbi:hypothetical protein WR25_18430 [Diploscapter pachys]|uniref:HECT-type E3 ubiquitin transferase n=1 Tax=Diploscapter pachys TaxID=2018661 RepID=A0A2A2KT39_9BILA|nr:hypothetical protein WR25_18430 [Diploscapter pachys]
MSSTNQLNGLNGLGVGSGSQSSSGTLSAQNLFPGPSSSAGTNPATVNCTLPAGISGNNSGDTVTMATVPTGQSNSAPTFVKITVFRTSLLEDSLREVMRGNPHDLRRRLYIQFRGEGLDYVSATREWFSLLSREVLSPMHGLFIHASNNNNLLKINPALCVNPDHLEHFEFIGRFIAMRSLKLGVLIFSQIFDM